jgi:S-methylmethionine-dependent homocysteine/selenocysteine methylase
VIVLLDGPMGTELAARGVPLPSPGWSAEALRTHPKIVEAIHHAYASAGAKVHRTNTFRTQPRIYRQAYRSLVITAVKLAKRAGGRVAGSMAPIEDCYRPDLSPEETIARACHQAMATTLADAGCDLLICETFPHAGEARIAVEEAVATGTETWAALTAGPDASLMTPAAMHDAARRCVDAGARAVLVACTAAERTLAYVEKLAGLGVPFGAYANAGVPAEAMTAERYVELAKQWCDAGATIIGACCGTGPAYIRALSSALEPNA